MNPHVRMGLDVAIPPSVLENGHVGFIDFGLVNGQANIRTQSRDATLKVGDAIFLLFVCLCVCLSVCSFWKKTQFARL
jgi:hypothetical protein